MENYICINGKKAELTEEQMKALGIGLHKASPFDLKLDKDYYFINSSGELSKDFYCDGCLLSVHRHDVANYCADKAILEQRALHETLNRLLWRYSMEHDGDKIDWSNVSDKWTIYYEHDTHKYKTACWETVNYLGLVFFNTRKTAENAIKEIVETFMKAHPEFKW